MDIVQQVKWIIEVENDEPNAQLTIRDPLTLNISNQLFLPLNTNLSIFCLAVSSSPTDVIFEYRTDENEWFRGFYKNKLRKIDDTFEKGFIYNFVLAKRTDFKCINVKKVVKESYSFFSKIPKLSRRRQAQSS